MNKLFLITSIIYSLSFNNVFASTIEILPVSYSFDRATDTGSYSYHDETGSQLTDGSYGVAPWSADLGNGHAYEWLGWVSDPIVNIDFNFGSSTKIDSINIGTVQDHTNDVVIPSVDIFSSLDGLNWTFITSLSTPESTANNNTYKTLSFDSLAINTQYVRTSIKHSFNGPWSFVS